mgnify:CR=1 FL=1
MSTLLLDMLLNIVTKLCNTHCTTFSYINKVGEHITQSDNNIIDTCKETCYMCTALSGFDVVKGIYVVDPKHVPGCLIDLTLRRRLKLDSEIMSSDPSN